MVQEMAQKVHHETVQGVLQEMVQQEVEKHQQDCFVAVAWRMSRVSGGTTRGAITDIQFQDFFYEADSCRT